MNKPKNALIYPSLAISMAAIASLGTMPYGFQFAHVFATWNKNLYVILGSLFAVTAAIANTALGTYSILNIKTKLQKKTVFLVIASFISTIPIACMCYFAYLKLVPFYINVTTTIAVSLINTGIAYTAIDNLMLEIKYSRSTRYHAIDLLMRIIGFMVGIGASLAACMAAIHGLNELFNFLFPELDKQLLFRLACLTGVSSWLPIAILYANSMQIMLGKLYHSCSTLKFDVDVNLSNLLIFFIALFSGTSFAQIAIKFFNANMHIPDMFKTPSMQLFIYHILIPIAYLANICVNYIALKNVFKTFKLEQTN